MDASVHGSASSSPSAKRFKVRSKSTGPLCYASATTKVQAMTEVESGSGNASESAAVVENEGRIKSAQLPVDWREVWFAEGPDPSVLRTERIFKPAADKESEIVFFLRGRRLVDFVGEQFVQVLCQNSHTLSQEEISALVLVLADLADPESFELTEACTRELSGRMVLEVRGIWLYDERLYHGVLLPVEDTGQIVQQIYLMAPPERLGQYDSQFEALLATVQWR